MCRLACSSPPERMSALKRGGLTCFGCVHMLRVLGGSTPFSAMEGRNAKFLILGVSVLSGIALIGLVAYFGLKSLKGARSEPAAEQPAAELVSSSGMILVQGPGRSEWRQIEPGAHLDEGDVVRTESSGAASIRYKSGNTISIPENTVFTVRNTRDNQNQVIEISAPPEPASVPPLLLAGEKGAQKGPIIELQQIVPFGRSLELIGRIEAGSSLVINNEMVEVTGDGSFKHFTSPFPPSVRLAQLSLKVTDLAGRTRVWTATHDFHPHAGKD